MSELETVCACGSRVPYGQCCELYHNGRKTPLTAVDLMRSRYSAFVYAKIDYLTETTLPAKRTADIKDRYQLTCDSIHWIDLEVVDVSQGSFSDKVGSVEFKASYTEEGRIKIHHECSRFHRKAGRWYYVDGVLKNAR